MSVDGTEVVVEGRSKSFCRSCSLRTERLPRDPPLRQTTPNILVSHPLLKTLHLPPRSRHDRPSSASRATGLHGQMLLLFCKTTPRFPALLASGFTKSLLISNKFILSAKLPFTRANRMPLECEWRSTKVINMKITHFSRTSICDQHSHSQKP